MKIRPKPRADNFVIDFKIDQTKEKLKFIFAIIFRQNISSFYMLIKNKLSERSSNILVRYWFYFYKIDF